MNWAALALALIQALAAFLTWLRQKELIDAGKRQQIADALARQAQDMAVANAIDRRVDDAHDNGGLQPLRDKWTKPD